MTTGNLVELLLSNSEAVTDDVIEMLTSLVDFKGEEEIMGIMNYSREHTVITANHNQNSNIYIFGLPLILRVQKFDAVAQSWTDSLSISITSTTKCKCACWTMMNKSC